MSSSSSSSSSYSRFLFLFFLLCFFLSLTVTPVTPTVSLTDKLIGHWRLDGHFQDSSFQKRALNLRPVSGPYSTIRGRFGKAINFPKGEAFLQSGHGYPILQNTFSVSMWIKPSPGQRPGNRFLMSSKVFWNERTGFQITHDTSRNLITVVGSGNKVAVWRIGALDPNRWHHVVVRFLRNKVHLNVNKIWRGGKDINPVQSSSRVLRLGRRYEGVPATSFFGGFDDVRIYARFVDDATISALFHNPFPVSPSRSPSKGSSRTRTPSRRPSRTPSRTPSQIVVATPSRTRSRSPSPSVSRAPTSGINFGLVGLWRLENNGADSSPLQNGGTLTLGGDATFDPQGKFGTAVSFSGNGYGTIPGNTGPLSTLVTDFSISVWVNFAFPAQNMIDSRIVSKKEGWDSNSGWEFNYNQGAQFFDFLGSGATMAGWTVNLQNNQWYNIVLLISGEECTFYLDGVNMGTEAIDAIVANDIPVTLGRIGGDGWTMGTFLYGAIDDLRIYDRLLTASDIASLQNENPYPSPQVTPSRSPSRGSIPSRTPFPSPKPFTVPAEMDPRFIDVVHGTGFNNPLGVEVAPNGRVAVWQKSGAAYWLEPNGDKSVLAEFPPLTVGDVGDHGLLSMAFHPNFATNRYVYFYYTVHPGEGRNNMDVWIFSRVVRYKVGANDQVDWSTERILIGATAADGIPGCSSTHTAGTIKFGHDGMLYVSHGDGARFEFVDWGNDAQCGAMFGQTQNIGAFRSQSLDTLSGKILRINPMTGAGLADNPFYTTGLSLNSPRAKIWALGLRNPFRMDIRPPSPFDPPGSSVFYFTDVGWNLFEEITVAKRGSNAGWPCYEGDAVNPAYSDNDFCRNMPGTLTPPLVAWHHFDAAQSKPPGFIGQAGTGITFYQGDKYPVDYQWRQNGGVFVFFWCDYGSNWVKAGFVDAQDNFLGHTNLFSTPAPVFVGSSPYVWDNDIHYVTISEGYVHTITYPESVLPLVRISSDRISLGLPPAQVQFWSDGTYDPYGRRLTLLWNFGDGTTSNLANPQHTYTTRGRFNVSLSASSPDGTTTAYLEVNTRVASPRIKITSPLNGHIYQLNDMVRFTATRSAGTTIFWDLQLMHNSHYHPQTDYSTDESPIFQMVADTEAETGERYSWRMVATATDASGNTASDAISLYGTLTTSNNPPTIVFFPPLNVRVGRAVYFDATNSYDSDGDLLEFSWDFGDGALTRPTGSIGDTRHIFDYPGVYTLNLTAWEVFGTTSTVLNTVYVHDADLIGLWYMDEGGGNIAYDSSGGGLVGTLVNGPHFAGGGVAGNALYLNTRQTVTVKGNNELNTLRESLSISFWIYPTLPNDNTVNSWIGLVSKKAFWDSPTGFEVAYNPSLSGISFVGSGNTVAYGWTDLPLDTWTHLAFVASGNTVTMYKNGVVIPGSNEINPVEDNLLELSFVKWGPALGAYFVGRMDNLRIYSDALTAERVQTLFNNQL